MRLIVYIHLYLSFQNRQLIDPNVYWFAIPSIGSVLKGISQVSEITYLRNDFAIAIYFIWQEKLHFWSSNLSLAAF